MKSIILSQLETYDADSGDLNTIIETPQGSRNKYKYVDRNDMFKLNKVLPAGAVFPFDFGFIPSTQGEDGDPLDVLVLLDEPALQGNLVAARLIGVIEAEQIENGNTLRNDRLVAVASECHDYRNIRGLNDLNENLVAQIEHFFISYNQMSGQEFKPLGRQDSERARVLQRV